MNPQAARIFASVFLAAGSSPSFSPSTGSHGAATDGYRLTGSGAPGRTRGAPLSASADQLTLSVSDSLAVPNTFVAVMTIG
jgi:hypothetical protein